jgi:glycosyltransferase involved in cell wall biosynthesis
VSSSTSSEERTGSLPAVAVFRREYARPTETFVVSQVRALTRYAPLVLCRSRLPGSTEASGTGLLGVRAFDESGVQSAADRLAYRYLRRSGAAEDRWYADSIAAAGAGLVHAHFGTDGGYIRAAANAANVPLVVSWYGYDVSQFPHAYGGVGRTWLHPVLRDARLHLAMTPAMAGDLRALGAPEASIRVHHFGIDAAYWGSGVERDPERLTTILMVASFVEKKGHADLISAFADVAASDPACTLRLVGSGPLESGLRNLVRRLGLESRVHFVGFLPYGNELLAEYRAASIYAHPARTARNGDKEGLPTTMLEAMASALPVASTRHAGIPDAVTPESGFLVGEGDVAALAGSLKMLLADPDLRRKMGDAGRARVLRDFDLPTQMRRLEALYDEARGIDGRREDAR